MSIMKAASTIIMIGGFIVIFSVLLSILKQSHILSLIEQSLTPIFRFLHLDTRFISSLLNGFLELTNGLKQVSSVVNPLISINVILAAFLLGFGGICVLLQIFSIISKTDISILPYFLGKLLQGLFAAIYTFLALKFFPFLSLDLAPVFANQATNITTNSYTRSVLIIIATLFLFSFYHLAKKKKLHS